MDTIIRTALIVLAVASIVLAVATLVVSVVGGFVDGNAYLSGTLTQMLPYLSFGKSLLNNIVGSSAIATTALSFSILMPLTYFVASFVSRIYRLIIGK